jgi:hypothetical protein
MRYITIRKILRKIKMGKKSLTTPRSQIRAALRMRFLRSRERASALKREDNRCEVCKAKASVAKGREVKLEVHHINGIDWEKMIDIVYETLLCDPKFMRVLCISCHDKEHENDSTIPKRTRKNKGILKSKISN